jgi:hypothetical protein
MQQISNRVQTNKQKIFKYKTSFFKQSSVDENV